MRIALCDDQDKEQLLLKEAIQKWGKVNKLHVHISCFCDAESFIFAWQDHSFDLVFLDIQMNKMSGIQLAEYIRQSDQQMIIVFVTNHRQYSLQGYDVNALNYLTKPLAYKKLLSVLEKAYNIWYSSKDLVIIACDKTGQRKLPVGDILYIGMHSHTAEIHTIDKTYALRITGAELISNLPNYFVSCHRSYIVNLMNTDCVYKDSLLLSDGESLPISRNHSKQIKDTFIRLFKE